MLLLALEGNWFISVSFLPILLLSALGGSGDKNLTDGGMVEKLSQPTVLTILYN